jgi:general stress protein YciG
MGNDEQSGGSDDQSKQPGGSANFANDRERASEAGRKGGQQSQGGGPGQSNQSDSGRSQQGAVQGDAEDSKESGNDSGGSQTQR